jgi:hypothetical protein
MTVSACAHAYRRDHYTPLDETAIPTGEIVPVAGTPFDFTEAHAIGEGIGQVPGGFDHNYVLFGMGRQAKFIVKAGAASNTCVPSQIWLCAPRFDIPLVHASNHCVCRVVPCCRMMHTWSTMSRSGSFASAGQCSGSWCSCADPSLDKLVSLCRPKLAAKLTDPKSGRSLKVLTTAPGLQFYSGNFLGGEQGKGGAVYAKHAGTHHAWDWYP